MSDSVALKLDGLGLFSPFIFEFITGKVKLHDCLVNDLYVLGILLLLLDDLLDFAFSILSSIASKNSYISC